jgi:hypothetical protein
VAVAALAAVSPELAILCLQASVLGIVLAIVAALLHRVTAGRIEPSRVESRSRLSKAEELLPIGGERSGATVAIVLPSSSERGSAGRSSRRDPQPMAQEEAT